MLIFKTGVGRKDKIEKNEIKTIKGRKYEEIAKPVAAAAAHLFYSLLVLLLIRQAHCRHLCRR